jgi:protein TonB
MSGSRIVSIVIVALIHIAVGYLLVTGLAISAVKNVIERVTTVDIEEPEEEPEEEPPPPPPEDTAPPPIVVPQPPLNLSPPSRVETTDEIPPPREVIRQVPPSGPPPGPPPPPPPPAVDRSRAVSPDGQARWQRRIIENYPARALRREIQGTVGVAVTVGTDGRVTGCSVTRSADPILDEAACADMTRYARFNPALDRNGNPTTGSWSTNIVYQIN